LGRNECSAVTYTEFAKRKELNCTSRFVKVYRVTMRKNLTKSSCVIVGLDSSTLVATFIN